MTLVSSMNNKVACDFPFQAVVSQRADTTSFLTKLTTPVSRIFLYNDIFRKITTKSQNPSQGQETGSAAR